MTPALFLFKARWGLCPPGEGSPVRLWSCAGEQGLCVLPLGLCVLPLGLSLLLLFGFYWVYGFLALIHAHFYSPSLFEHKWFCCVYLISVFKAGLASQSLN